LAVENVLKGIAAPYFIHDGSSLKTTFKLGFILRPASIDDLSGILLIYNDAILNTTAVYEYQPFTPEYVAAWFSEKTSHQFPVVVAEADGVVAGFATYGTFRARAAYKYTVEHSVYVHPGFRRLGVGKVLLNAIIEEARSQGVHVMVGGIDASNATSIHLHRQAGFTESGIITEAAYKFGKWLDLAFVQLTLEGPDQPVEG